METEEISVCPFRIYTEVRPALTYGRGDVTVTGFMKGMSFENISKILNCGTNTARRRMVIDWEDEG